MGASYSDVATSDTKEDELKIILLGNCQALCVFTETFTEQVARNVESRLSQSSSSEFQIKNSFQVIFVTFVFIP